ncbi:MAG: tetratricopeptide repeat protein [Proteobacteria bacterium]|nr:tetratricopeptide repeat protein [Pseudomonadota bacterium]
MKNRVLAISALAGLMAFGALPFFTGGQPAAAKGPAASAAGHSGFAGRFLSSHFAQSEQDWEAAGHFLDGVLERDPQNAELLKRSMILAMGAGDLDAAVSRSGSLLDIDQSNSFAWLIQVIGYLSHDEIARAGKALDSMPEGDVTDFVRPLIGGWIEAAQGRFTTDGFNPTAIHSYSGALIALYMNRKTDAVAFAKKMTEEAGALTPFDTERTADVFLLGGDADRALSLYKAAALQEMKNLQLEKKIIALDKNDAQNAVSMTAASRVKKPAAGVAVAMSDMARILLQESSGSSARLFAQMALALDPGLIEARLLLANALVQSQRYEEAIASFSAITPDYEGYLDVQRYMAELMDEAGQTDRALKLLNDLFVKHNDVESLIRIGDLYRSKESYGNALKAYNKAASHIGKEIPEEFWYLLYARGMVYEREGNWGKAEQDLKAALVYRPDHPYLLNYLGYAWADQGQNLEESLKLIERAVTLRPADGYITDSLGWVYYMMGRYEESIPHLEKAVELLPYDPTLNDHLGDAYWRVGRKMEARFQWERSRNYAENDEQRAAADEKLRSGLPPAEPVKEARTKSDAAPVP